MTITRSIGAMAVALALSLSACAAPQGATSDTNGASDSTLRVGAQAAPNSLDPAQLHDGTQRYVWGGIFDTLLYYDNDGSIQPAAAERWEYSDDGLTLTLTLREDMTFSTGDPVTSEAVKATLERTRDTAGPQQSNLAALASIDTPDDHTVVLNLSEPDPNLLVALSFGSGVIGDPATLGESRTALDPVGSGPYVLDREKTVDGSSYVLERRDDHWNADAYPFKTVTVRAIEDRTALFNALLTGELDAGTVDATQAKQIEGAGLKITRIDGTGVGALILADRDGAVAPELADVRVRQAINMAFDKETIVDKIYLGLGSPSSQIYNPASDAFVDGLDSVYDYDPERAVELLAEAGYGDGFTLTLPANLFVQQIQPTITQALGDIGITTEWEPVPAQQSGQTTNWGAYYNQGGIAPPSRTTKLYFGKSGSQNPFGSTDPELDALLAELSETRDDEAANETYQRINEWSVENAWFAPIFLPATNWATVEGVEYVGTSHSQFDVRVFDVSAD
jgi:peptide/nickel transport system substrate-binding protein